MIKNLYFPAFLFFYTQILFPYSLSGYIYNNREVLPNASIIITADDINFVTISDKDGYFIFNDLEENNYNLNISFIGYLDINEDFLISSKIEKNFILTESLINFEQIVITGTRNINFIKDSPILTHVINNKVIKQSPFPSIQGVMEYTLPNVQIVHGNHGSINRVKIQGLDSKYTTFLIDGVKVTGEFAGNIDFSMMNILNVDRIEFVDGAMSTLYGSSAMGGVVNIITKRKNIPYWGSFSILHDYPLIKSLSYNFGFNLKKLYYQLSIINKSSPGYNIITNDPTPDSNTLEPYEDKTYIHTLIYNINESISIDLKVQLFNSYIMKTKLKLGQEIKAETQSKYKDSTYTIKFKKDFNNGSNLRVIKNKEYYKKKYYYPYLYSGSSFVEDGDEFVSGQHYRDDSSFIYSIPINNNNYVFGADIIKESYSTYNIIDPAYNEDNNPCEGNSVNTEICFSPSIFNGIDAKVTRYENSFYLYHENKINNNSELSIGLRTVNHLNYKNKLLPSLSYLYNINGIYNLRVTYGSGYRVPSIKELYYNWEAHSPAIYGSVNLKASESDYYSLSIDKKENNEFSFSLYLNKIKNMISTQYQNGNLYYGNYNQVDIKGLNMHYSRYLNPKNLIKLIYNYTLPESNSNEILEGISKHAVRIHYVHNISSRQSFNINIKYCGKKYNYDQETYFYEQLNDYWMTDIIWSLDYDYIALNLGVKNIFHYLDKNHINSEVLNTYDPGRRFYFSINFSY